MAILFWNDNISRKSIRCGAIGRLLGHKLPLGIHCSLILNGYEIELTDEGVIFYDLCVEAQVVDNCIGTYIFQYPYTSLAYDRAVVLQQANIRLHTVDLFRCVLNMQPDGLVCTTFIANVLGFNVTELYKPEQLLEAVSSQYTNGVFLKVKR